MQITENNLLKMAQDQNNLQKIIYQETGMRKRTIRDIELSLIEEILEWNKERGNEFSHKTWKKKEFDKAKHDEEFTDILFFALEKANLLDENTEYDFKGIIEEHNHFTIEQLLECFSKKYEYEEKLIRLTRFYSAEDLIVAILDLAKILEIDLVTEFYKKLEINYNRFGYDYDIETGEAVKKVCVGCGLQPCYKCGEIEY